MHDGTWVFNITLREETFRHQANLLQVSSSWLLRFISRGINIREFLQKYFSSVQNLRKLQNFLLVKVSPLKVVYHYVFLWSSFPIRQNSVLYNDLHNRAEYLIFGVFFPALPPSDLDSFLPFYHFKSLFCSCIFWQY